MAQSVKQPTLDFNTRHHLTVPEIESRVGLPADSVGPAWDSLSLSALPCLCTFILSLSLSLKINKNNLYQTENFVATFPEAEEINTFEAELFTIKT